MPVVIVERYTREQIRANKNALYVFGDNFGIKQKDGSYKRTGYGGQAAAARDEPNAVGIATKLTPDHGPNAYLTDEHFDMAKKEIDDKFTDLFMALEKNQYVIWPKDGIGTGLADLENKAPKIWAYLQKYVKELLKRTGS